MVDADIQGHRNTNATANMPTAVSLNSSTSTTLIAANAKRIFFGVSNDSPLKVWIKFQAASVDNDKKGILLQSNAYWEMPIENTYTGEISAINDAGASDVNVTEY